MLFQLKYVNYSFLKTEKPQTDGKIPEKHSYDHVLQACRKGATDCVSTRSTEPTSLLLKNVDVSAANKSSPLLLIYTPTNIQPLDLKILH